MDATLPTAAADAACTNCGAARPGRFCADCGQERLDPDDLHLRRFARRVGQEVLDLDSALARSLRTLFTRPGELTAEFVRGRRRSYLGPFKLYLLATLLYFVVAWPALLRVAAPAVAGIRETPGFVSVARKKGLSPDELARRFDDGFQKYAKVATDVLAIPLLALALAGAARRARRRYPEHLVFTLHYSAVHYLVASAWALVLLAALAVRGSPPPQWAVYATYLFMVPYAYLALRRVYGLRWTWPRAAAFLVAELVILATLSVTSMSLALLFA